MSAKPNCLCLNERKFAIAGAAWGPSEWACWAFWLLEEA